MRRCGVRIARATPLRSSCELLLEARPAADVEAALDHAELLGARAHDRTAVACELESAGGTRSGIALRAQSRASDSDARSDAISPFTSRGGAKGSSARLRAPQHDS